jgi:hypothetical protein
MPSHARSRATALGWDTSTAAAPMSSRPHRRRPHRDGLHPRFCVPSSPATQGGSLRLSRFGRSPRRRGACRRRGHPALPFLSWTFRQAPRVTVEITGFVLCTGGHMLAWPQPIRQDPLRLGHSRRGHMLAYTAPSRTVSRRIACGSQWWPSHAQGCG